MTGWAPKKCSTPYWVMLDATNVWCSVEALAAQPKKVSHKPVALVGSDTSESDEGKNLVIELGISLAQLLLQRGSCHFLHAAWVHIIEHLSAFKHRTLNHFGSGKCH
jgi:hypothetical protein